MMYPLVVVCALLAMKMIIVLAITSRKTQFRKIAQNALEFFKKEERLLRNPNLKERRECYFQTVVEDKNRIEIEEEEEQLEEEEEILDSDSEQKLPAFIKKLALKDSFAFITSFLGASWTVKLPRLRNKFFSSIIPFANQKIAVTAFLDQKTSPRISTSAATSSTKVAPSSKKPNADSAHSVKISVDSEEEEEEESKTPIAEAGSRKPDGIEHPIRSKRAKRLILKLEKKTWDNALKNWNQEDIILQKIKKVELKLYKKRGIRFYLPVIEESFRYCHK